MTTRFDHVFYIASFGIVHTIFLNDEQVSTRTRYIKPHTTFAKIRLAISSEARSIIEELPKPYRAVKSITIVYGSPWASFTVFKENLTKQYREQKKLTTTRAALFDYHALHTVHGTRYPRKGDLLAVSSHHVGYQTKKGFTVHAPTDSIIEASIISLVDRVDLELHQQLLAALFPWYLEAPQLLVMGWEGLSVLLLSRAATFDGYLLLGTQSVVAGRFDNFTVPTTNFSSPAHILDNVNSSLILAARTHRGLVAEKTIDNYTTAVQTSLSGIFLEVAASPKLAVICEPFKPMLAIVNNVTANAHVAGLTPRYTNVSADNIFDFMQTMWHTIK